MNKQPTPETDARTYGFTDEDGVHCEAVHADFARRLERERDEARQEWGKASMDAAQLLSEKTKVIAERDELREEVASLRLEAKYHDEADALRKCRERERDEARYEAAMWALQRDEARGERDALRDAVNALHDYVHGKRNDDKDISEILNGAMKI